MIDIELRRPSCDLFSEVLILSVFVGWRRKQSFKSEQGIFESEDQFFTFLLFALVYPLDFIGQRLNLFAQSLDSSVEVLNVVSILAGLLSQKEELLNVINDVLEHDR